MNKKTHRYEATHDRQTSLKRPIEQAYRYSKNFILKVPPAMTDQQFILRWRVEWLSEPKNYTFFSVPSRQQRWFFYDGLDKPIADIALSQLDYLNLGLPQIYLVLSKKDLEQWQSDERLGEKDAQPQLKKQLYSLSQPKQQALMKNQLSLPIVDKLENILGECQTLNPQDKQIMMKKIGDLLEEVQQQGQPTVKKERTFSDQKARELKDLPGAGQYYDHAIKLLTENNNALKDEMEKDEKMINELRKENLQYECLKKSLSEKNQKLRMKIEKYEKVVETFKQGIDKIAQQDQC